MFIFSITVFLIIQNFADSAIVTLPKGQIQGTEGLTDNGIRYFIYQDVPYAAPPIGNLRFKPPVEHEGWNGILNTTEHKKVCMQWNSQSTTEDCLIMNIFTPSEPGAPSDKPVYVFIHGGSFLGGSADARPQWFIEQDIIIVKINYRLGPFGFLSTGDTVIPGNFGLKDQSFALKWIQQNIHLFGGDPTKVTIGGQSAGSASVSYQIISKKSAGLFRGAILESGSALCTQEYQGYAKEYAYQLAQAIDPNFTPDKTTQELYEFLLNVPAKTINEAKIAGPHGDQLGQGWTFAPVIEPEHEEAFITEFMDESLKNGNFNKIPVIQGVQSEERLADAANLDSFKQLVSRYDANLSLIVNDDFNILPNDKLKAGELFRNIYTNGDQFQDHLGPAVSFKSDEMYTTSVIRDAIHKSNYVDVYFYVFAYHGKLGNNNLYVEGAERAQHSEELQYLWHSDNLNNYPEADIKTKERMILLWSNFIKYLNPTPEETELLENIIWPKLKSDNLQFLNINETLEVRVNPKKYKEWEAIVNQYGHPPFKTY